MQRLLYRQPEVPRAVTVSTATAIATTNPRPSKYCFIHGKRSHHSSAHFLMIKINLRTYPYSPINLTTFETTDQFNKVKVTTSSPIKVKGIGKEKCLNGGIIDNIEIIRNDIDLFLKN